MVNIKIILLLGLAAYEECSGGNISTCCCPKVKSPDYAISERGEANEGCTIAELLIDAINESGEPSDQPNEENAVYNLGDNDSVEFNGEEFMNDSEEVPRDNAIEYPYVLEWRDGVLKINGVIWTCEPAEPSGRQNEGCTPAESLDNSNSERDEPSGQQSEVCTPAESFDNSNSERSGSSGYYTANDVPNRIKDIGTMTTIVYNIEDAVHYLGDNVSVELNGSALLIDGQEIQGVNSEAIQEEGVDGRGVETSSSSTSRNFPFTDFCVVQFNHGATGAEHKILTFRGDTLKIDDKVVPGVNARERPLVIEWDEGVLVINGTINEEFGPIQGQGFWSC